MYRAPGNSPQSVSTSDTVILFTTTNSLGSVVTASLTSTFPSQLSGLVTYTTDVTTTDSLGSTIVETSSAISSAAVNAPTSYANEATSAASFISNTISGAASNEPTPYTIEITSTDLSGSTIVGTSVVTSSPISTAPQSTGTSSIGSYPPANGQQYTTDGKTYEVTYGTDYPGDDLATPHVNSLAECLKACSDYVPDQTVEAGKPCIAASFGEGNVGGNCYLKYTISQINIGNGGFAVGRNIDFAIPAQASTVSYVQYPSTTSSPLAGQSVLQTSSATSNAVSTSGVAVSTGTSGSSLSLLPSASSSSLAAPASSSLPLDQPSTIPATSSSYALAASSLFSASSTTIGSPAAASSIVASADTSSSAAATSSPIAPESSPVAAASTIGVTIQSSASAPSSTAAISPYPLVESPPPNCGGSTPNGDSTSYTDVFGFTYNIRCGLEITGQNADQDAHADTFEGCLEYCSLLEGCIAVTYLDGNNADNTNSNCYPYYVFTAYRSTGLTQTFSGVNVNGASPGAISNEDLCDGSSTSPFGPDTFGNCYAFTCDQYLSYDTSTELYATDQTTLESCLTYCSTYTDCVAVDFFGPHVEGTRDDPNCIPIRAVDATSIATGTSTAYAQATPCS